MERIKTAQYDEDTKSLYLNGLTHFIEEQLLHETDLSTINEIILGLSRNSSKWNKGKMQKLVEEAISNANLSASFRIDTKNKERYVRG